MVALWRVVAGGLAVVLGVAWILAPVRMSHLQTKVLYFGRGETIEGTESEAWIGRISGLVLAALGLVLALGVEI